MKTYQKTHPWLTFGIDTKKAPATLWLDLGEAQSKCEHIAGIPLRPDTAEKLHTIYLAKGVLATTAIEGNTLSEDEVLKYFQQGELDLPKSREYQLREIQNIQAAYNEIVGEIKKGNIVPLSPDLLKRFNYQVLDKLEVGQDVVPGEIRKDNRGVGRYKCPAPEDCPQLVKEFCDWMNGEGFNYTDGHEIVCGIIKAIIAHVYFVWIHPFGDGNGRTARLIELKFLMESGVPSDAVHLLTNHYNSTRTEYYRHLDAASQSGGDLIPFLQYAVAGFVDQLKEQIKVIREQQIDVTWVNYIHDMFRKDKSPSGRRRRLLAIAISKADKPLPKAALNKLTPEVAIEYAKKTSKTLSRDLNALMEMDLIKMVEGGYTIKRNKMFAFLPIRREMAKSKLEKPKKPDTRQMMLI